MIKARSPDMLQMLEDIQKAGGLPQNPKLIIIDHLRSRGWLRDGMITPEGLAYLMKELK